MGLGLLALSKLRVNQIPDVEQPVLTVTIAYPGASPDTVEREVVNRIEKSLQGLSGVRKVNSTSREGSALAQLRPGWACKFTRARSKQITEKAPSCKEV